MTIDLDNLERLARAALQFLDWAAGEGICPTEEGVPSPDVPLFEFASKTGNEDYASYPDVISAVFARLREAEAEVRRLTTVPDPVVKRVSDILDEKSAWIARPSPEVTEAIAVAVTIAAHSIIRECDTEAERYAQAAEAERDRLQAELDEARAQHIASQAECAASCDDPHCPYTHRAETWRDRADRLKAELDEAVGVMRQFDGSQAALQMMRTFITKHGGSDG